MQLTEQRQLFVLKFQDVVSDAHRPLTIEERLAGWRYGENWDGEPRIVNEGHQAGSIRDRRGPHVLSWNAKPGQQIVAVLPVEITVDITNYETLAQGYSRTVIGVKCDPVVRGSEATVAFAKVDSVLGRSVSLGEDGAEDAFGNDALRDHLEAYLFEDDCRDTLCEVTFCEIDKTESEKALALNPFKVAEFREISSREYAAWKEKANARVVTLERKPE